MKIIKRILLFNRRLVRDFTPLLIILGCSFMVILGVSIHAGKSPDIDYSDEPIWVGSFFICLGGLLLLSFAIDTVIKTVKGVTLDFKIFRTTRKAKSLKQRIEDAGR